MWSYWKAIFTRSATNFVSILWISFGQHVHKGFSLPRVILKNLNVKLLNMARSCLN